MTKENALDLLCDIHSALGIVIDEAIAADRYRERYEEANTDRVRILNESIKHGETMMSNVLMALISKPTKAEL